MTVLVVLLVVVLGTAVVFGLIEFAANRLFDHVDVPKRDHDDTAPPRDAP